MKALREVIVTSNAKSQLHRLAIKPVRYLKAHFASLEASLYRLAIKSARYLKARFASLESGFYGKLSYQSNLMTTLPYSKRKIQIGVADNVGKLIYLDGLLGYEGHSTSLWGQMCRKADLILDIGAQVGIYSILAADIATNAQVHAFEPLPENYSILSSNIESSGYKDRIHAHQMALSNASGETQMVVRGASGSTLEQNFWLDTPSLNQITVQVDTLDSWLKRSLISISALSLLKVDVETHEPNVLNGAKDVISAGSAMLCEVLGTFTEHQLNFSFR